MGENRFIISYYKNSEEGIHIQRIRNSKAAQEKHSHDYFQIYYILHGSITHITEGDSSQLAKGDVFIIPPGFAHSVSEPKDAVFYTFSFTKESIAPSCSAFPLVGRYLGEIENESSVPAKNSLSGDSVLFVENLMDRLYTEFCDKQIGYVDAIRAYAAVLLTILARNHFERTQFTYPLSDGTDTILYCIEYIDENFAEPLTLTDMAKRAAMSKSAFCKRLKAVTGTTFNNYLNSVRIKNAVSLIKKRYKISAISGLCGYNDFSTFYRNFKAIIGCSPNQYRRSVMQNEKNENQAVLS